ncbi:G-protein-signaling modulator 1 isoform X1 [Austrofundulus limnaeus]|uniref:G-protein-signaling modulator 1-like isoform X1 n=1 Tax=Austrofundulus limnaeus TaxID=52670 RepID=A0A2I4CUB7_AUSLI|nr:PREDICTED: G-protein-signaling modulator 1-like isoform X1 [Austrofundulus limnaeus]XP_013883589.1 PREDICTED: G-protein-signaling modulator 1-like isoform X1 [Austrofundulus limnaeus]
MAEKNLPTPTSGSSPAHNGTIGVVSKRSPSSHQNGSLEPGLERQSPRKSRTPASTSPLRTLRALRGLRTPATSSGSEEASSSSRPRGQSFGSVLSSRTRSITAKDKASVCCCRPSWCSQSDSEPIKSSHQAEPEALLDLILESQSQRLDDQRASLSLLPDSEPAALCGACSPDQNSVPSLDFYYMLIHYQSDRMEDQRSSLPHLDDVTGLVPEGQEDFFSLIQRVQSRRMDEQRASMMLRSSEEVQDLEPTGSAHHHHHHH